MPGCCSIHTDCEASEAPSPVLSATRGLPLAAGNRVRGVAPGTGTGDELPPENRTQQDQ